MRRVFWSGHTWTFLLWLSAYSSHRLNSFSAEPESSYQPTPLVHITLKSHSQTICSAGLGMRLRISTQQIHHVLGINAHMTVINNNYKSSNLRVCISCLQVERDLPNGVISMNNNQRNGLCCLCGWHKLFTPYMSMYAARPAPFHQLNRK